MRRAVAKRMFEAARDYVGDDVFDPPNFERDVNQRRFLEQYLYRWGQVAQCTREGAATITTLKCLCIVRPDPVHLELLGILVNKTEHQLNVLVRTPEQGDGGVFIFQ